MNRFLMALWAAVICLQAPLAWAAESTEESPLASVERYLTGLTTVVADFSQVAPDGSLASGKFFLKRPGKMRWQYEPPTPILMVANANVMTFYDYELQQVSNIPLDETLMGLLSQEKVKLRGNPDVTVDKVTEEAGVLRVSLHQTKRPGQGNLTLTFSSSPLLIRNISVTDAQGQITNISLSNARFGSELADSLFIFKDPRKKR